MKEQLKLLLARLQAIDKSGKGDTDRLKKLWADLAEETWQENSGFQVAEVNSCENSLLTDRFDANSTSLILFRDRKMYKYPLGSSQNWPTQSHTLQLFATAGYQQAEPLSVPEPKSLMTVYWSILVANMKELHMLGFPPIAGLVVGFIVINFAVFLYLNERKVSRVTGVQKKQR